jgi:hypothetical protein
VAGHGMLPSAMLASRFYEVVARGLYPQIHSFAYSSDMCLVAKCHIPSSISMRVPSVHDSCWFPRVDAGQLAERDFDTCNKD